VSFVDLAKYSAEDFIISNIYDRTAHRLEDLVVRQAENLILVL
jgi:hypothetical protein